MCTLQLVWKEANPDDHKRHRRGQRSSSGIQLPKPGNGDADEQGEGPGEWQHGGVHRHHSGGAVR